MPRLTYKLVIRDGTMCLRRSTAATFRSTRANQYYARS